MKKFNDISEVRAGDWVYAEHPAGTERTKYKCIWNDVENKRIELCWWLFGFMKCSHIADYTDKQFKSFKAMNK